MVPTTYGTIGSALLSQIMLTTDTAHRYTSPVRNIKHLSKEAQAQGNYAYHTTYNKQIRTHLKEYEISALRKTSSLT